MTKGKIVQIFGQVVDVEFAPGQIPPIQNALKISGEYVCGTEKRTIDLTLEIVQHLGDNLARTIVLGPPEGLSRGLEAVDTGAAIKVPVGKKCLGRLLDALGRAIDNKPAV